MIVTWLRVAEQDDGVLHGLQGGGASSPGTQA